MQYNDIKNGITRNPFIYGPFVQSDPSNIIPSSQFAFVSEDYQHYIASEDSLSIISSE